MAKAAAEDKLVFLDFWTDWCGWCERLERETFSDETVAAALDEVLCYSIDAESRDGALIARKFRVMSYPTLLFVEPDGSLRDRIGAFLPAAELVGEVERIARNENTISSMRVAIVDNPNDLALRYQLAIKLRDVGDRAAFAEQMDAIRRRDPEGETPTGRLIKFDELYDEIHGGLQRAVRKDPQRLIDFLAEETSPALLYSGWALIALVHEVDVLTAAAAGDTEAALAWGVKTREAYRNALPHVPASVADTFGNQVAWSFWEAREHISDEDKRFALAAAEGAHAAAPDNTSVMDTLACCVFMNGDAKRALQLIERAAKLDPENELWDERRVLFGADG
jgi:thioredoxin-like negative regulator of GroEL